MRRRQPVVLVMVAWSEEDERHPVVIWIRVQGVVGFSLVGGLGVRLGDLTPSLWRYGRFPHWHWQAGNHFGQGRRRGTRHNIDGGSSLILLARTGVLQRVGKEVWPLCLVAAPNFGLCMVGAQQGDGYAQEKGSPNPKLGRLRNLYPRTGKSDVVKARIFAYTLPN